MENNELTPAEQRVRDAFPRGEHLDFREAEDEDPAQGGDWGPERTVRAPVLRRLLLNGPQEPGEIAALKLSGLRISGALDLRYATTDQAIRLSHCSFDQVPQLYGCQLRQLNLSGSVLPGLNAATLRVDGVLRMTDCRIHGPVRLGGARISGALFMDRAELTAPDAPEAVLQLNQATIGDDLWAPELRTHGETRLDGASVSGSVNLERARLTAPGSTVLTAQTLTVGADVRAKRLRTRGRIELRGSHIAGRLDLGYSRLSNPGGTALRASSSVIGELWLHRSEPVEGTLNLRRSRIEVLSFEPEVLPGRVLLNDLSYSALNPHEPADRRLPMLEREGEGYLPFVYEQLTAAYNRVGDGQAARLVQLAKQRRHRTTLTGYARAWGHLQDATVGYGFRPLRAAVWLMSLLAIGSITYGLHQPRPLRAAEAPHFNPVFYTFDLLLPVISFGLEDAFAPDGWYQVLSYVLIVTGWILATTIVAGVTRSISRQ
ncbi:hypothetical protein OK074_2191 [Actinobacteria bacterium OK074]|nr:hypothetical protein OK074_2191 [Actinobacteria bacterium OK074]